MPGFEVIGREEVEAIQDVFTSGGVLHRYGFDARRNGLFRVADFETVFAHRLGALHAHGVTSGTAALLIALKALGIRSGDEVITQSFTFVATVEAIIAAGATPILTEIDESLNMDPFDLERKITSRTKAIIPVHMLGVSCAMDAIEKIARAHELPILEDACEALGATFRGKMLGTIGALGAFSFDFGKTITTGEGGMIVTNDETLYRLCSEYADHGHEHDITVPRGKDTSRREGFNYRMMELQGALGCAQLKKLDFILSRQRAAKAQLKERIQAIRGVTFRQIPDEKGEAADTLVFFFEESSLADRFAAAWQERGYATKNIPDALDWHYAGRWNHIFTRFNNYRGKPLPDYWPRSTELLSCAVALPIMVQSSEATINTLGDAACEIAGGL